MLLSAPIATGQLVLGKYLALLAVIALFTLGEALLTGALFLGTTLDTGKWLWGLTGLLVAQAAFAALCLWLSARSTQPAIAAVLSFGALLLLWIVEWGGGASGSDALTWFSLAVHQTSFLRGVLASDDLFFYLLFAAFFTALAIHDLERVRRGKTGRLASFLFVVLLVTSAGCAAFLAEHFTLRMDLSTGAHNTLTAASRTVLERLDEPLAVTAFASEDEALRPAILALVERYRAVDPRIRFAFVDPVQHPERAREKDIARDGTLLVEYHGLAERVTRINEQTLTLAIQRLMRGQGRWIAFLSGHGERAGEGQANHDLGIFGKALETRGFEVGHLNLANARHIPDNAALLVIAGPRTPLLDGEITLIGEYVAAGGDLLWLADPGSLHGLESLAERIGVRLGAGTIRDPSTRLLGIDNEAMLVVAEHAKHPALRGFDARALFPEARPVMASALPGWDTTVLMESTPLARAEPAPFEGLSSGSHALALALTRPRPGTDSLGGAVDEQRIVVVGDGDFLSNMFVANGGNLELGLRLVEWLMEESEAMPVSLPAAPDADLRLDRVEQTVMAFGSLIVLPLVLAMTGIVVSWRRGRR